jgi:thiol-disulfide isomerase/thioredoxin
MSTPLFSKFVPFSSLGKVIFAATVLATSALSASAAQAAGIAWQGNLQQAAQQAAAQHKPLLVMVKARWCGPCHKMLQQTFPDAALAARINSQFVPVLLDADDQAATVQGLGIEAMPTVIIMSPERKVAGKFTGFQTAAQLDARLAALAPPVRHFAPPQFRHWSLPAPRPLLANRPNAAPQTGASFLRRHAIASLPVRPSPMLSGQANPGLAPSPYGPSLGFLDTLTAAREFSAGGSTPVAATVTVGPTPNPPD